MSSSSDRRTRDPVNQPNITFAETRGAIALGLLKSREWIEDPRRFLFSQARYKFVSKMLSGRQNVLEIGCGDAFNAPIVMQEVKALTVTDYDEEFIKDAATRRQPEYPYEALVHNFLEDTLPGRFDAAYSLDVLEHIPEAEEERFLANIRACLEPDAVMIVGMPSLESQVYASPGSKAGHINCKTAPDLKALMERFFHSVFMFSMNDEIVHTGYHKMAHYILALAAHPRS
ncbi:class I SAM-dependent methyltransferase [Mangrovibrevibacter kandeliae]|uniref:class I SAM-dependent methyltransferase n=1 Tax=Mangrovibrevibacter kandeliae TaxID=2968473 RepID=UPI002118FB2F|nr:class I SAM-dependent methyltransferase [Aurantimonas sp. CSK15Z-1]MCQ8782812.1 class I SAM-dependent methyltransferase [Aurantimonas sp. CSK15Z-1]